MATHDPQKKLLRRLASVIRFGDRAIFGPRNRWTFRRSAWHTLIWSLKWLWGGLFVSLLLGSLIVSIFITEEKIDQQLKAKIYETLGAEAHISHIDFNVLTGLSLGGVSIFLPENEDKKSKNTSQKRPFILADNIDLKYSIPHLLIGQIKIAAARTTNLQVQLIEEDGVFRFEKHLNDLNKTPAVEVENRESSNKTDILDIIGSYSSFFFLPLKINIQNVGVENLKIRYEKWLKGKQSKKIALTGLTSSFAFRWFATQSHLEARIKSHQKEGLSLSWGENKGVNIPLDLLLKIDIPTSLRKINIEKFQIEAGSFFHTAADGYIESPEGSFKDFDVKWNQVLTLDISDLYENFKEMAHDFVPKIYGSGLIEVSRFNISGTTNPKSLIEEGVLPLISISSQMSNVSMKGALPNGSFDLNPINSKMNIAAGPALHGIGSQIDIMLDGTLKTIDIKQNTEIGDLDLLLEGINSRVLFRAFYPEMSLPIFKSSLDVDKIQVTGADGLNAQTSFHLSLGGEGDKNLDRLNLSLHSDMGEIFEVNGILDCQIFCQSFRSSGEFRVSDLSYIHKITQPLNQALKLEEFFPKTLEGDVESQFSIRGTSPHIKTANPDLIAKTTQLHFNSELNINNFSSKIPQKNFELKDSRTRLTLRGNETQQSFSLSQNFQKFCFLDQIEVNQFSLNLDIDTNLTKSLSEIKDPITIETLPHIFNTQIATDLIVGDILKKDLYKTPLKDIKLSTRIHQKSSEEPTQNTSQTVELSSFDFSVDNAGLNVEGTFKTKLSEVFEPQSFSSNWFINIDSKKLSLLPSHISKDGSAQLQLGFRSSEMKNMIIEGLSEFQKFNIEISENEKNTFTLENADGRIPFYYEIDIEPFMNKNKKIDIKNISQKYVKTAKIKDENLDTFSDAFLEVKNETQEESFENLSLKNPFSSSSDQKGVLADYANIKHLYKDRKPLSIDRVFVKNLEFSRIELDMELKKDLFSINQYLFSFLGGKVQGDLHLGFKIHPVHKELIDIKLNDLETSLHLTRLNTHDLIKNFPNLNSKKSSWSFTGNPYLDGSTHLKYDFPSNDMIGGIEMTSIGKEQLKMMLYYVDPEQKNPTISELISALSIGDLQHVSIPIKNGQIDMTMDIRVLGTPVPTPKLTRFPISQFIGNIKKTLSKSQTNSTEGDSAAL